MIGGTFAPIEMPKKYLIEMLCDRIAACKVYQKDKYTNESALNYFLEKPDKQYMHENTSKQLELYLRAIAKDGEEKTFASIKNDLKNNK